MVNASVVLPFNSQTLPGLNQEAYQSLQQSLQAVPPHHIWFAACDDIPLQRRLAAILDRVLLSTATQEAEPISWLRVDPQRPDVAQQIMARVQGEAPFTLPYLQILGVEQLTHCASEEQYRFLASLRRLATRWPSLNCSLVLWLPRPWLRQVNRVAPSLAQICDRTFEFLGDPTPLADPEGPEHPLSERGWAIPRWSETGPNGPSQPSQPPVDAPAAPSASPTNPVTPAPDPPPGLSPGSDNGPPPVDPPPSSTSLWHQLEADLSKLEQAIPHQRAFPPLKHQPQRKTPSPSPLPQPPEGRRPPSAPSAPSPRREGYPLSVGHQTGAAVLLAVPPRSLQAPPQDHDTAVERAYALRDRVEAGDHSPAALEAAIQQYEALLARSPEGLDLQRAEALNDLGSLYWLLAQQTSPPADRYRYLQDSQRHYEAALTLPSQVLTHDARVRLHSNLGGVYCLLAVHGHAEAHLGSAVRAFHRALQYTTPEEDRTTYATLQTHLGTAYWSLAQQSHAASHLHRAITAYQEALAHRSPHTAPLAYAQIQNNLGIAYWSLAQQERPVALLEQAIAAYQDVLAYRTPAVDAPGYAATHNNLGTAYWDLGRHCAQGSPEQRQAWENAIAAYDVALTTVEVPLRNVPSPLGFDPWATHHSLGVVHDQVALGHATPARAHHWRQAITHYVYALEGWDATGSPLGETALQAIVHSLRNQAHWLGLKAQQRSLSQIPARWLPEIWRHL
ncbi:tetratricopeptide repeat protein [Leptolyngbya sp. PCC 6406]|uniref:tetratricopeptide repeat protein n=1 Tax=Leptolyngbya sp. PCC 6406 TaxID=1173264 RepID=UPI0002ABE396|nr:tetratricopeptide repeat protein [Leptolyngbya sp. PCC 6406]